MNTIKTGDLILFSNNTATGFILRTATSSLWNHVGVAIRYNTKKRTIELGSEGDLFVLEINTGRRLDALTGEVVVGAALSRIDWVLHKYNTVAVRRLKENLRTPALAQKTKIFADKYRGCKFTQSFLAYLGVWFGIPLNGSPVGSAEKEEMFCTELTAHYYDECVGSQIINYAGQLKTLFGEDAPPYPSLYTPEDFTHSRTPFTLIFQGEEEIIHRASADIIVVLFQPLILVVFCMIVLAMLLP